MKKDWLVPLTGVAFLVLVIIGFIVGGEPPSADDPVQEIVDFYVDDKDSIQIGAFIITFGTVFFVFFANYLRTLFRETATSATILVGAAIFAVGAAIDTTILIALAEAADDIEPASVQTLQALWDNDFVPLALGITVFLVSLGISILRTDVLPRWLGWVILVLALISVTPAGFIAFPGTGLLVLVLSVWLAVRARGAGTPPSATPPPPAAPPPPV
jgi:hypothetical protein